MAEVQLTINLNTMVPPPWMSRVMEAYRVAEMVDCLPEEVYRPGVSMVVQAACLEMFFVHVRSLVAFLTLTHNNEAKDFTAKVVFDTFSPQMSYQPPTDPDLLERLESYWVLASEQVVHFSKKRARQDDGTTIVPDVSPATLYAIRDDVLTAWDHYAGQATVGIFLMPRSKFTWRTAQHSGEPAATDTSAVEV